MLLTLFAILHASNADDESQSTVKLREDKLWDNAFSDEDFIRTDEYVNSVV